MTILPKEFFPASQYRNIEENDFLTTSSLPYFLGEHFKSYSSANYPNLEFTKYAPKDTEIYGPGIAYRIYRRTPGFEKQDSHKCSLKTILVEDNSVKHVYTQYQTVTYEFVIWGLDTTQVDDITDQFESFLFQIQPELQIRYVRHFLFEEEIREDFANLSSKLETQYKRVLRYMAILQKPYILDYGKISSIQLKPGIKSEVVKDVPVFRGSDSNIDFIEYPIGWDIISFKSVSLLKDTDLTSRYIQAEIVSGSISAQNDILTQVFIPDVDYSLYSYKDTETGHQKKAIVWLNESGAKRPVPGEMYYISWSQPESVGQSHIFQKTK